MSLFCYHCGDHVPDGYQATVVIFGEPRSMCCPGCYAVATTIVANVLTSYYQYRTSLADKSNLIPEQLKHLKQYDQDEIQQEFIRHRDDLREITLSIDGISCAACAWLIEHQLLQMDGVIQIRVNTATSRAVLRWDPNKLRLSESFEQIYRLGYKVAPFEVHQQEKLYQQANRTYLYRLGIAGLGSMQVMMLAVGLYFEFFGVLEEQWKNLLRWVSFVFATPVLLYSAQPFYINAWRSLKVKHLSMDVPITIALITAYGASVFATISGTGEVFYESISMFTFFLLLGRYLEMRARMRSVITTSNLLKLIPSMATLEDGTHVLAKGLKVNDRVRIIPGNVIPIDGVVLEGASHVNESALTGEPLPHLKQVGSPVYSGTINGDGDLLIEVTKPQSDGLIANIIQLQDIAQENKPQIVQLADIVARYFVLVILIVAFGTWLFWHYNQPEHAFWIMLSVLVATCPCALSLATPTALTCATTHLNQIGVLIRRPHVLETLSQIDHVIFDKTGTLTEGTIHFVDLKLFHLDEDKKEEILAIAASMELKSNHPIAKALIAQTSNRIPLEHIENKIGFGIQATYQNRQWRIGRLDFVGNQTNIQLPPSNSHHLEVYLSCDGTLIARFLLSDTIRLESAHTLESFHNNGIRTTILTGDRPLNTQYVAEQLNVDSWIADAKPADKLKYLNGLKNEETILMVGDGVNDAPVLAGAHVSVAMSGGSDIAKSTADVVLLGDNLSRLNQSMKVAVMTKRVIAQNLFWTLIYNLTILPLACIGLVSPYIAVLGMSFSSLVVVSNSLRLTKIL